jgi:hypothetical protein
MSSKHHFHLILSTSNIWTSAHLRSAHHHWHMHRDTQFIRKETISCNVES